MLGEDQHSQWGFWRLPRVVNSTYTTHFPLNIRSFRDTSLPLFFMILVLRTVSQQKFHCLSKFANLRRMWMCQTVWQMDSWDPHLPGFSALFHKGKKWTETESIRIWSLYSPHYEVGLRASVSYAQAIDRVSNVVTRSLNIYGRSIWEESWIDAILACAYKIFMYSQGKQIIYITTRGKD